MIRCIRLWTGSDDNSYFEEGIIDLSKGERGDILSSTVDVASISFRETRAGGAFEWHDAPARQFVITLSGTLDFQTRTRQGFSSTSLQLCPVPAVSSARRMSPGCSMILGPGVEAPFVANSPSSSPS
jgi:hypothetical protein